MVRRPTPSLLNPPFCFFLLSLLRPDMLVIQGLSLSSSRLTTAQLTEHDPTTLALLKASCLLYRYIVELSFTCNEFYNTALERKMSHHHYLVTYLLAEGWKIAPAPVPPSLLYLSKHL